MGRELKLNEQNQQTVLTLVSVGLSQRRAAMQVGCSPSTISKLAARDEAFAERLLGARRQSEADPLELVKRHAEKSWRAAAWLLEKCHPHLYGKNASQADLRAVEEERMQTLTILAEEISDPQLLERIIDRLHQADEHQQPQAEPRAESQHQPQDECVAAPPAEQRPAELKPASGGSSQPAARPAATANVSTNGSVQATSEPRPTNRPTAAKRTAVYNLIRREDLYALYPICRPAVVPMPLPSELVHSPEPACPAAMNRDVRRDQKRRGSKRGR